MRGDKFRWGRMKTAEGGELGGFVCQNTNGSPVLRSEFLRMTRVFLHGGRPLKRPRQLLSQAEPELCRALPEECCIALSAAK